jgi:copper oxidase (laccase) domain-containing protein
MREMGLDPQNFLAGISPSIGPCCFQFRDWKELLPQSLWPYRVADSDLFDFWELSRQQLLQAGLRPGHIEISGICTRCQDDFFSYRSGDLGRFGLMAGVLP